MAVIRSAPQLNMIQCRDIGGDVTFRDSINSVNTLLQDIRSQHFRNLTTIELAFYRLEGFWEDDDDDVTLLRSIGTACPVVSVLAISSSNTPRPRWVNAWTHEAHDEGNINSVMDIITENMKMLSIFLFHFVHDEALRKCNTCSAGYLTVEESWIENIHRACPHLRICSFGISLSHMNYRSWLTMNSR